MSRRTDRVGEAIQELVARLLLRDIKDPRIGLITITAARVSPDLRHARIYFSSLGDEEQRTRSLRGLRSAAGFIRGQIARQLNLRVAPEIVFEFDPSLEEAERLSRLLKDSPPSDDQS
ncbi:MAG TPA: 30S ribosome-binding factor RbfA [Candidatus Dormibacteraeota bacterium]|nr:30S ribosome-binding factor RbfA [Candidatus Dormibacteraeota bacterium]